MWNWFKKLFKIGVKTYEIKNPDILTKVVLDELVEEIDKIEIEETK